MPPIRLRISSKPSSSSRLSNHFDKSTEQMSKSTHWKATDYTKDPRIIETEAPTTNDADRIRKHRRDVKLKKRLQDIALYVYVNQDTFIDLYTERNNCKVNLLDDEWSYSPGLNKKSRQFIEDILKNIDEAVHEYKSSDENHSPDKATGSSDHKNTCTASTTQKIPAEPTLDSDKNDGNSGNDRDSANDKDSQKSDKVDQYVYDRELSRAFWNGATFIMNEKDYEVYGIKDVSTVFFIRDKKLI